MEKLYRISSNGALQIWSIEPLGNDQIMYSWGQVGGATQFKVENVFTNQSGRTLKEQQYLQMDSRINRKKDLGYKETIEEARASVGTNAVGMLRPMLAQVYDRSKHNLNGLYRQYKYNGHRCLVARVGDELIAYTRNGKPVNTISHILNDINIPEGTVLDGELYVHGMSLQGISSLSRKVQKDNIKLKYMVYDQMSDDIFAERFDELNGFNLGSNIIIAPTIKHDSIGISNSFIDSDAKANGYEGFIVRNNSFGYESGKRSSQLLKVKSCLDDEFLVINIVPSKDGWAILTCRKGDKQFNVPAPGTMDQKHEIYRKRANYIGRVIRVEFAEYTAYGTPFHPVAIEWRDKYEE